MNKLLLCFSVLAIMGASSCKKGCVQCMAYDKDGNQIYQTHEVCGSAFDMKNYKKRFETNFGQYSPKCMDVN